MSEMDEDTLRRAKAYAGSDFQSHRMVRKEVLVEYGSETWGAIEFAAMINEAISQIPAACLDSATVELEGGYEETTSLKVAYERSETAEEVAARVERAIAHVDKLRHHERATYEALKAKYG